MDDTDMIADVRRAKEWLDQSCTSFRELGERLAEIERAYSSRSGGFAQIPLARTEADTRLRQRGQRNFDALGVHELERDRGRPVRVFADRGASAGRYGVSASTGKGLADAGKN